VTDLPAALRSAWQELLPDQPELGETLIAAYNESSRHYHDLRHLSHVLAAIDLLAGEADDVDAVRLAAWFHDAVYDVRASDNEERSAKLAETALASSSLAPDRVAEVARLVRLTATHGAALDDPNGVVLCDADLAVLAGGPDEYAAYTRAVRVEYAHVPEPDFRRGRAAILQQLLDLPMLYGTARGRRDWEPIARANLIRELHLLA
jgi:predicted metal-dependent HD superfamily phosphohydrolase